MTYRICYTIYTSYQSKLIICIWSNYPSHVNRANILGTVPRFVAVYLLPAVVSHDIAATDPLFLSFSLAPSAPPPLPVRKECDAQKGRFLAFFCQNIYTTFVSWMCERTTTTNCDEGRGTKEEKWGRTKDDRHSGAPLCGISQRQL